MRILILIALAALLTIVSLIYFNRININEINEDRAKLEQQIKWLSYKIDSIKVEKDKLIYINQNLEQRGNFLQSEINRSRANHEKNIAVVADFNAEQSVLLFSRYTD
jgi:uncharacterized small protein (DUF1192 family)